MILPLFVHLALKHEAQTPAKWEKYSDLLDCISINTNQIQVKVEASPTAHYRVPASASIDPVAVRIVSNLQVEFRRTYFSESSSHLEVW